MVLRIAASFLAMAWALSPSVAGADSPAEQRIAAISGVHTPHQGFALSAAVPSDRLCLELAQNLDVEALRPARSR